MARPKGSKNKTSVVSPDIKVDGEVHVLESAEESGSMPILKSVGVAQASPNSRNFISYVITSQGDKVLKIEASEPDLKAIAIDNGKTAFVTQFLMEDGIL